MIRDIIINSTSGPNISPIHRCNTNQRNNNVPLKKINDLDIKDGGSNILIKTYFHVFTNDLDEEIIKNIKYSIEMLNKDFSGNSENYAHGLNKIDSLPDNQVNGLVKSMYHQSLEMVNAIKKIPSIQFIDIGYKKYDDKTLTELGVNNLSIDDDNVTKVLFKSCKPQDQQSVLNLYIMNGSSLLGLAMFPWMDQINHLNAVLINSCTFGYKRDKLYSTYNLNKTMTHEIGHWLGLLHTFQSTPNPYSNDEYQIHKAEIDYQHNHNDVREFTGDCVSDTPVQLQPTYGNPIDNLSNYNSLISDNECCMFTNFMDYADDICLFCFTKDQLLKMRLFIYGYRNALIN